MRKKLLSYLTILLEEKLPFLLLRTANDSSISILSQRDQEWHKKAPDNMAYGVFSKFQKSEDQVFIIGEDYKYFKYNNSFLRSKNLLNATCLVDEVEQNRYVKLVEKAVSVLKESSLKKVVLSRKQTFKKSKTDLCILMDLLDQYPTANCYFFYHPKIGKWMGATPEILAHLKDGKLQTMSLAGTALFNENRTHVWGEKEIEEQQLVTDFITDNLQANDALEIHKSKVKTVRAGNLIHLRTDIVAAVKVEVKNQFVEALHPTPAVCGMPRDLALGFINENENYDRSFYTGYLGMVEKDQKASYFVNLRCMEVHDNEVDIYVGGGVTALSDPNAEYAETVNKLTTMKKLLN